MPGCICRAYSCGCKRTHSFLFYMSIDDSGFIIIIIIILSIYMLLNRNSGAKMEHRSTPTPGVSRSQHTHTHTHTHTHSNRHRVGYTPLRPLWFVCFDCTLILFLYSMLLSLTILFITICILMESISIFSLFSLSSFIPLVDAYIIC